MLLDLRPGRGHLFDGPVAIPRLTVYGGDRVAEDSGVEAFCRRVDGRFADAVVGGEADDDDTLDAALTEQILEGCGRLGPSLRVSYGET